ncbi:exosome complex component 10-like [Bolinopsis microptera]|uniref:exosome complex component 10-like n=1 Tax=Bolinopsis microptera TaxID=2820187 RepID=UPI003078DDB8
MPPRRKKKRPAKVIDLETVNETENSSETSPIETIPPVEDSETVKPTTKKKKGKKNKKTAVSPDDSVVEPVCPPESEEEAKSAPQKSSVRKRPTAADLIISEDPSPVPEVSSVSETLDMSSESSSKVSRRAAAVDFMDESTLVPAKTRKSPNTKAALPKEEVVKAHSSETVSPNENEEMTAEEEGDGIGGGLEFLGYPNFDAYSNSLLPAVVQFLKVTKQLPSTKDEYDFFLSYPSFMAFSKNQGQRVLQLIGKIFKHHHVYQAWNTLPSNTVTGIEEQSEAVVEANDTLLERVDKILDMLKQNKNENKLEVQQKSSKNVLVAAWNANSNTQQNKPIRLLHSKNILRPQLRWKVKPDNTSVPFVPNIKHKPNAKVPLPEIYKSLLNDGQDINLTVFLKSARGDQNVDYPHPYQHELETLDLRPWQHELGLKQEPKEVKDTPLTIIDQPDQIPDLVRKLEQAKEIAVDLEAHSYRSYLGFTCLMQLSTRTEDFIVDTLSLRTELLPLNTVFTNPAILKVLHGGINDIRWLQRDLGLYIVNMFDTYHASKQLGLPRCSLSYLLHKYCDVTADKQYQLADWRIRPLPDVMIKYAREDTHYLLYVYDCLRYELLNQGMHTLESVYRNSTLDCQHTFRKPVFTQESYMEVYHKIRIALKPQQKECLKLIYAWRDHTARSEDESTAFVLPNHMMFKIAELLPGDQEGILGCCNPPPPLVRLHVQELHLIVEKARHYNPLLDPANNISVNEAEYTPGFLDMTHQSSVESIFTPKQTPARRIKERKEIFYIPKSGPDIKIKNKSAIEEDCASIISETGTISESVSSLQFFDTDAIKNEITDAVRSVTDSMSAPFRMFMTKIAQLRDEEKKKEDETPEPVNPIQDIVPPENKEETNEEDSSVIIFKQPNKRTSEEAGDLRATTKRRKKTVGELKPFSYEEVTMTSLAAEEEVKPLEQGDMLNKGDDSRATSIRQRTNIKSGNKSSFQKFLKKKFKK